MTKKILCLVFIACGLIAACSDVKETLGVDHAPPDEFAVVERAPLTLPPEFNLVPPQNGADAPAANATPAAAKELLLGSQTNEPNVPTTNSAAENLLLQKAGQGDATIRQKIYGEKDTTEANTTAEKLGIVAPTEKNALDPMDEVKRLQQQKVRTIPLKPEPAAQK